MKHSEGFAPAFEPRASGVRLLEQCAAAGLLIAVAGAGASAANVWNGQGVGANTGTVWTDPANYVGGSATFNATTDLDFSTITDGGPTTLSASTGGTYAMKDMLFGTTSSTITAAELLNINGTGVAGATTLALSGGIALPSPVGSIVTLGSDLELNLTNTTHNVKFNVNSNVTAPYLANSAPVIVINSKVTGGGASAIIDTNYSQYGPGNSMAPAVVLTNDASNFDAKIQLYGRMSFTSIANVGEDSSLGHPTTAANGLLVLRNGGALDYVGSGDQSTNRAIEYNGTLGLENFATTPSVLTFTGTFTNIRTSGFNSVRLGASDGNTLVMDTVIGDAAAAYTNMEILSAPSSTSFYYAADGSRQTPVLHGTVVFTKNNTYTGTTSIKSTLLVNGAHTGAGAYTVASGGILGGTGSITTAANAGVTVQTGGKLSPGASAGTLTMSLGTGLLDISAAVLANNSASMIFELGSVAYSDKIALTAGTLKIGSGILAFNDFTFTALAGLENGVYTLFDTSSAINGTLASTGLSGAIGSGGATGVLSISGDGQDLLLTISGAPVPEPATLGLLTLGLLAMCHRSRP